MKSFKTFNVENINIFPVYIEMRKKAHFYELKDYDTGNYPVNEPFEVHIPFSGIYECTLKPVPSKIDIPMLTPISTRILDLSEDVLTECKGAKINV